MGKGKEELGKWVRPVIVYVVCILVYSFVIVGNLCGTVGDFDSVKINSEYKVVSHFAIKNKGLLSVKSQKIQLNMPEKAHIHKLSINKDDKYLIKKTEGGENYDHAIFTIEGLKGRRIIKGTVVFLHNTEWDKNVPPISFSE